MKWVNFFLISASFLASLFYLPRLPDMVPMHWNLMGEVDSFMPKNIAVWIMPGMSLIIFTLYQILPYLDPKKHNYKSFNREWHLIQTSIIAFLAYMQFIIFYIALNPETGIMPMIFFGIGLLFLVLGFVLPKLKQNYFIGIRVPWTLSSEDNWKKTHWYGGRIFSLAGSAILIESFFLWNVPYVILGSIIIATMLPMIYSFLLFKKCESKMGYIYLCLIILAALLFMIT